LVPVREATAFADRGSLSVSLGNMTLPGRVSRCIGSVAEQSFFIDISRPYG
jgi:hypothetical protein